jgi:uncharacterized SAM-dependent methyltransferase
MSAQPKDIRVDDRHPDVEDTLHTVRRGLALKTKKLPSRLFYDERGSALFEAICEQPEYYLTRTEIAIMRDHAGDIADTLGPDVRLVEYGSGSGIKTRMLLEHLVTPVAYVPVEISRSALMESVAELATRFPGCPDAAGVRGLHAARCVFRWRRAHRDARRSISRVRPSAISRRKRRSASFA